MATIDRAWSPRNTPDKGRGRNACNKMKDGTFMAGQIIGRFGQSRRSNDYDRVGAASDEVGSAYSESKEDQ